MPDSLIIAAAKSTVADITGDRYELLDMYGSEADKRRDVLLRHNECGKEYHTDYHKFVAGKGRCDCERHNLKYLDEELKRYIYDISGHRYICVDDKIKRKSVTIKDTITGEVIKIQYWRAVQELMRPTPSELLPCETKVPNACKPRTAPMFLMNYLKETYENDGVFFLQMATFFGRFCGAKRPKKVAICRQMHIRIIGSVKVHLKNAPCNITEDNYKVLQVADYFCYYYNRYYPSLTEKEMDIVANYIRTVPIKVIIETILLYPEAVQNKIKSML